MSKFSTILKGLTDTLLPPKCLKCGKFLITEDSSHADGICVVDLSSDIEILKADFNNPLYLFSKYFCNECLKLQRAYELLSYQNYKLPQQSYLIDVHSSSTYDGLVKESIHLLKYNGKTSLANPLGLLLFHTFIRHYENKDVDFIVPIPLYRWRVFKRGFNQSFLLLRDFKRYWLLWKGSSPTWKIAPEILIRKRDTKSQTGFNREERRENIRGAFAIKKNYAKKGVVKGKNIVLVDDVHTTGATTTEAGKVLLESGAASVGVIVVAQA